MTDWFWGADKQAHKLLRQLINGPLRGRVKLRLAGDLHFYMRHEFLRYDDDSGKVSFTPYDPTPAGGSPGLQGGSPMGGSPLFFGQAPALDESEVRRRLFGFAMDRNVGIDNPPAEHLVVCGGGGAFRQAAVAAGRVETLRVERESSQPSGASWPAGRPN